MREVHVTYQLHRKEIVVREIGDAKGTSRAMWKQLCIKERTQPLGTDKAEFESQVYFLGQTLFPLSGTNSTDIVYGPYSLWGPNELLPGRQCSRGVE